MTEEYSQGQALTMNRPTNYTIFKSSAAARFQIEKPKEAYKVGCVYLQTAPSKGKVDGNNTYDWENKKISVKFGINDISKIYHNFKMGTEVDLYHSTNDNQKSVKFLPKEGGGYFLSITDTNTSTKAKTSINVPISDEEISTLTALFFWSIPLVHNWM